jgi:N12 class adenine-specific DNA methylase
LSSMRRAGAWQIDPNHATRWSVAATQTYGTERVGAMTLFEQALNQQVPTVTDPAPDDRSKRIVNQKETIAAREKAAGAQGEIPGVAVA